MFKQVGGSIGFFIADAILIPLLALFLALALWVIKGSQRKHGKTAPFYVGVAGAVAALVGVFVFIPIYVIGLIALVGASIWDIVWLRNASDSCGA